MWHLIAQTTASQQVYVALRVLQWWSPKLNEPLLGHAGDHQASSASWPFGACRLWRQYPSWGGRPGPPQRMWQEKPARSQSPHSQACRHTSVSLRWSLSNSLQQELASKARTLSLSGRGRGLGWPQLEMAFKARSWQNFGLIWKWWSWSGKKALQLLMLFPTVPSAQASSANMVSMAKCRSQCRPTLNLPFNWCWQLSFSKTRHLPKCHKV